MGKGFHEGLPAGEEEDAGCIALSCWNQKTESKLCILIASGPLLEVIVSGQQSKRE